MGEAVRQFPKTAAEVYPVREVTLLGEADHAPFAQLLAAEELQPIEVDGKARLFLSSTDTRFHGIRFREFSISVLVENQRAASNDEPAAFLLQAFNSVRFFAWIERTVFSTPYSHAQISVNAAFPASVEVERRGQPIAALRMAAGSREPLRSGEESWQGVVHLPTRPGKRVPADSKLFFATLLGDALVYGCQPEDEISFFEQREYPVLAQLNAANFRGLEWLLREHARHRKSKTVSRNWQPDGQG